MQNKTQFQYQESHSSRTAISQSNIYRGVAVEMIDYINYYSILWLLLISLVQIFQVIQVY